MKNIKKYTLISLGGLLAVSSIFMTVVTATSGAEVSSLQKEEAVLLNQKRYLEDMLIKTMSVSQLNGKSLELGYERPTSLVYVAQPEAVAKLP